MWQLIRKLRLNTVISLLLKLLLIAILPLMIIKGEYLLAVLAIVAILLSLSPIILKKKANVNLPWIVDFLITLALYLHMGGLVFGWYNKFAVWDVLTHLLGTTVIALLGFLFVFTLYYSGRIHLGIRLIGFFTFIFAMAIGGLWEIAEYSTDAILGTNSQPTLRDTIWDLIWDAAAGLVVAGLGMLYAKYTPEDKIKESVCDIIGHKSEVCE